MGNFGSKPDYHPVHGPINETDRELRETYRKIQKTGLKNEIFAKVIASQDINLVYDRKAREHRQFWEAIDHFNKDDHKFYARIMNIFKRMTPAQRVAFQKKNEADLAAQNRAFAVMRKRHKAENETAEN